MMLLWLLGCGDPVLDLQGNATTGAVVWQAECALCHGVNAEGTSRGGALLQPSTNRDATAALDVIRFGRGDMPAFSLDDQTLADLLAWLPAS
jgi:mono/diheme cytochrome c family protein